METVSIKQAQEVRLLDSFIFTDDFGEPVTSQDESEEELEEENEEEDEGV